MGLAIFLRLQDDRCPYQSSWIASALKRLPSLGGVNPYEEPNLLPV